MLQTAKNTETKTRKKFDTEKPDDSDTPIINARYDDYGATDDTRTRSDSTISNISTRGRGLYVWFQTWLSVIIPDSSGLT